MVGGQIGNAWTNAVHYYDINLGRFDSGDMIENLPESLVAPSISSEFFGDIGLIVCGQN